ncbi:MAG TPA: hypothetical protein VFQ47_00315 [Nitrososphaera sp.]|nr:hypothetical protein [Nitrososphaera sp.]
MPLSEKVRIEIFIPDLPDPIYNRILEEFGDELSYAFGGCPIISSSGKFRSASGVILPDKINILFTDTPFEWDKDRVVLTRYAEELHDIIQRALEGEEAILISVNPVYHVE